MVKVVEKTPMLQKGSRSSYFKIRPENFVLRGMNLFLAENNLENLVTQQKDNQLSQDLS